MTAINQMVEQLRDIYCGRATYNDDAEWVANLDHQMRQLCDEVGLDFAPQEGQAAGLRGDPEADTLRPEYDLKTLTPAPPPGQRNRHHPDTGESGDGS